MVLIPGTSKWVRWELTKIKDSGQVEKPLIVFLEVSDRRDAAHSLQMLINVFFDTEYAPPLKKLSSVALEIRSIVLSRDSVTSVLAKTRSRNSYQLAAAICGYVAASLQEERRFLAPAPNKSWRQRRVVSKSNLSGHQNQVDV